MISVRFKLLVAALTAATGACARSEGTPIFTDGDRVRLTMRPVGDSVWELSYRDASGQSLLRVRPHLRAVPDSTPFVASTWTLYTVPSSSPDALLGALARTHGNPSSFKLGAPVDSMRLDVALLAVGAARNAEGAFGRAGTGTWIAAKLFFADDEGELYLNLNPSRGEAEFGVKDEEYGPAVLREISRFRSDPARKSSNER